LNTGAAGCRSRRAGRLAALALIVGLAACRSLPAPALLEHRYAGRFSLAVLHHAPDQDGRREAYSGRFALQVGAQALALDLVSPLGATIARFETDPHEARLLVPDAGGVRVERGSDAQALSERVLGWSLPVAGMPDWVQGRPVPSRPFQPLPGEGAQQRFEQDGWAVTVDAPEPDRPGLRLQMDRAGVAGSPDVALRVVLDGPPA